MKRESEQGAPGSLTTVLPTADNLLLPSLDESPHPMKAGAQSQVFLRARQIRIRNRDSKSGAVVKTDGAGSLACASPGLEPLPRTEPNKAGESVNPTVVAQGLQGFGQSLCDCDSMRLFYVSSEIRRHECCFFQTQLPPKLYVSRNETIIHDDKILERIYIIHFFLLMRFVALLISS